MDINQNHNNKMSAFKNIIRLNKSFNQNTYNDAWAVTFESLIDSFMSILLNPAESP